MPKTLHVSVDGRSGARVRELDFDLTRVPVSTRTSKGLTVTQWPVKDVKAVKEPKPEAASKPPARSPASALGQVKKKQ